MSVTPSDGMTIINMMDITMDTPIAGSVLAMTSITVITVITDDRRENQ